ncbi:hypothetical protein BC792_106120 [Sphingobacterium allocomposti]|uniref:Uncharacterized protein n=1 Tax=Sphingobacterium allocomposti TaxID=415956 RepID=A0A5S5DKG0_9SPHI|nr:hypothetical protein BC792_106120 [Sphingobacterium composti Yoo et al. 2007 non Ten et al. 2007]
MFYFFKKFYNPKRTSIAFKHYLDINFLLNNKKPDKRMLALRS